MDKRFQFNLGFLMNLRDFRPGQLARQHRPGKAHLCKQRRAGSVVDAHLRRAVQRNGRIAQRKNLRHGQILHDHRVHPGLGDLIGLTQKRVLFLVGDQSIDRHMHAHATAMAIPHGVFKALRVKIRRAPPGVKALRPQIDRVRSGAHRRFQLFPSAYRRQYFHFLLPPVRCRAHFPAVLQSAGKTMPARCAQGKCGLCPAAGFRIARRPGTVAVYS